MRGFTGVFGRKYIDTALELICFWFCIKMKRKPRGRINHQLPRDFFSCSLDIKLVALKEVYYAGSPSYTASYVIAFDNSVAQTINEFAFESGISPEIAV